MTEELKKLIDVHSSRQGDDLIGHVATTHNTGETGYINGYGREVIGYYYQELPKAIADCKAIAEGGKCTGKFIRPSNGRISSGFGPRRVKGGSKYHEGTDFAVPIGMPIKASDGGRVVRASWFGGYGNTVDIKHCNGWITRYAHLNKILVRNNQPVSQGDIIAESGNTGRSTGPHLHFETRQPNGVAIDPMTVLR